MELALTIIAGLGVLLFLVSYLSYVASGFRHHFVTGIISALPILNVVTLPSLWDKSRGKFIIGFIGLLIASGAWLMGANKGLQNLLSRQPQNSSESLVLSAEPDSQQPAQINTLTPTVSVSPVDTDQTRSRVFNEENMLVLPNKALYTMSFELVPVDKINTLQGRIVQITNTDNEELEGRIRSVTQSSVVLDGLFENELPIASIKELRLMVKKAIK
jgi:small nuclear ribonucleoprotein (snRNP)-like protein